jgi:hypothetical protein
LRSDPEKAGTHPTGIFRDSDLPALLELSEHPEGLSTPKLSALLGIGHESLPPVILGWHRRCRRRGMYLDDYLRRQPSMEDGRPVSIYRLTDQGRALVSEEKAR